MEEKQLTGRPSANMPSQRQKTAPGPPECTVLVSSCDAYADIWAPFFALFAKFWPDRPFPVVLNTETIQYTTGIKDFRTLHPARPTMSWTTRLANVLAQISSPYIILMLDDFFLTDYVDTARVLRCLAWMRSDPEAASFTFYYTATDGMDCRYDGFSLRPRVGSYIVNAVLALWRKDALLGYLTREESAWEFEVNGISQSFFSNDAFYIMQKSEPPIFPYSFATYGLFCGRWLPDTKSLFRENGIRVDFSKRGFNDSELQSASASIKAAFRLRSSLFLYKGYDADRDPLIICPDITGEGAFRQEYAVEGAMQRFRWIPTDVQGFGVNDYRVCIRYRTGVIEQIALSALSGNCLILADRLVFNQDAPYLLIAPRRKKTPVDRIWISGNAVCPAAPDDLKKAAHVRVAYSVRYFNTLYWIFALQKPDPHRLHSLLIQREANANWLTTVQHCRAHPQRDCFSQKYTIKDTSDRRVRWIPAQDAMLTIRSFQVMLRYEDDRHVPCDASCFSGNYATVDGTLSFAGQNRYMEIMLPAELPSAITVSGVLTDDLAEATDAIISIPETPLYRSRSWRLTRPMRALRYAMAGEPGGKARIKSLLKYMISPTMDCPNNALVIKSKSWRITAPLRRVARFFRGNAS